MTVQILDVVGLLLPNPQQLVHRTLQVSIVAGMFMLLAVAVWGKQSDEYSDSERRYLAQFPELSMETIVNGEFMNEFETYAQDQFPLRETFRRLKSQVVYDVLGQKDNNGIYVAEGHVSKLEYPLNEKMLEYAANKFESVYETYIKGKAEEIYFSIIPDKNYFLAEENGYLAMDYDLLFSVMREKTSYMKFVDIAETLSLEDYYYTDTHWRQENLLETAQVLAEEMGVSLNAEYQENVLEKDFYGVYFGQSALELEPDTIVYLNNEILETCTVTCYDTGAAEQIPLYDIEKEEGKDAYEMFLSGTRAVVKIENPLAEEEKKLVVFRDSFANSLIPLMMEGYSEIDLIDLRYIDESKIGEFVDFDGAEVLFLYSTLLLNNSLAMK